MSLFQNSVLNKYLSELDSKKVEIAWKKFVAHFHNPDIQENIQNSKEEQYQGEFLIDLFVNVFGYIKNPTPNFNLTTELKNVKGAKKADGAILQNDEAIAVIELKGTDTIDLAKVETQAFGYKNNHPKCLYVITSNFEKLRFYIENAVEFEEFNLFNLDRKRFDLLWLCLSADNLLKGLPKKIKDESISEGEIITKKLYRDYSNFRNEVFSDIVGNNPHYDKLTLFRKTQKLLDRFLFILFAEDKSLLPPNSTEIIIKDWKDLRDKYDEYFPLYDRFKKYFGYLNEGYKGKKHDIFAYNGGLFLPDDILDNIKIDDELLSKHTKILSNYDFASEVSVNILGHIFEHSLTEIESIQAELKGETIDKSKTKRKKDGVFYTPTYITKYIVDNTIGKLCTSQKATLEINEEDYEKRKGRRKATVEALQTKLDDYREWLLNLTICDPACGSGAFLNQALEFLIAEHRYVDELYTNLEGFSLPLTDLENAILENNLFGVDINEESVEIAKLSLWLRTAQKGRKLTTLNNNIKCGNSLIDDAEIAGEKAFVWKDEFPKVFASGGFDVVIGNPPYGDYFSEKEKNFLLKKYSQSFSGTFDMYIFFFDISLRINKINGKLSFITPNTFLDYNQFSGLRNLLTKSNNLNHVIGLTNVFEDAIVDTAITTITKNTKQQPLFYGKIFNKKIDSIDPTELSILDANNLTEKGFILKTFEGFDVKEFCNNLHYKFSDLIKLTQGITTGGNDYFINSKDYFTKGNIPENSLRKVLKGKTINRYRILSDTDFILYSTKDTETNAQEKIKVLLEPYKAKLSRKRETKQGKLPWYCLHWSRNEKDFNESKILIRQTANQIIGVLDTQRHYPIDTIHTLNLKVKANDKELTLKSIVGILNSTLFKFLYLWKLNEEGKVYPQVKKVNIEWLPFPKIYFANDLSEKVDEIQNLLSNLEKSKETFLNYLQSQFPIEKFTQKLQNWHELKFADFINELGKAINKTGKEKLTKSDEMEWMELFETKKVLAQAIKSEIDATDRKIDEMVYELYGLEEDDIAIVEKSLISD